MKRLLFLLLVLSSISFACAKNGDEYISLSYNQTLCSDPWATGSTDSLTVQNAERYLDSMGLYIAELWIRQEQAPDLCPLCGCKTGKTFHLSTFKRLKERYAALGFQ